MCGKMNVSLPPYTGWSRNRSEKGGGGIASVVAHQYKNSTTQAGEGEGNDEYLITRIECFSPALNIINCYGEQRKTQKEEVEDKWRRLRKEMEGIRAKNEFCLLSGDLNKLVGCGEWGVPDNHPEVSFGGKLLRDLLSTGNWFLVNALGETVVTGGPFTRQDPATGNKSCLDLFVVSADLLPYVDKLVIDSQREMAVARAVKMGKNYKLVYSDHFTCLLTFSNLPKIQDKKEERKKMWNLAKEGGWRHYEILTNKYSEALERVLDKEDCIEVKMKKFNSIHDKIKFEAFGKVTIGGKEKKKEEEDKDGVEKAEQLFLEQSQKANIEIEEIKRMKTSRAGKIWEIRKRVVGGKKYSQQASAIIDPNTGGLVVSRKKIQQVSLKYCQDTLSNNTPTDEFKEQIRLKQVSVKNKLQQCGGAFQISENTFQHVVSKFKRSRKRNYDFLVKSGEKFKQVVFKFCQEMVEKEEFPIEFQDTTLHMIFKGGKGRRQNLPDNRFVHSKPWWPRTIEACIVEEGLKGPLVGGSSIYQIGGQPGHRSEELVYVLKSVIARQRAQGKAVLIQPSDIQKFFDKEMIEDVYLSCEKRGADLKAARLWYKLNMNTRIQVRTGVGLSEFADVGAVVGQGTIGGALGSQAVLDERISEHFPPGGEDELNYGGVPLAPLIFPDDVIHITHGIKEARLARYISLDRSNFVIYIYVKQCCA